MSNPRSTHRGRLAGVDLHAGSAAEIARLHKVSREAVMQARRASKRPPVGVVVRSDGVRWNALDGADLTRPVADLVAEYKCSKSAVYKARQKAGLSAPPAPREPSKPAAPARTPVVKAPPVLEAVAFAERDLVAALKEELAIGSSPFVAAVMVAPRFGITVREARVVAERMWGRGV